MPLQTPLALPCGESICRKCLPAARANPDAFSGGVQFSCPVSDCARSHAPDECSPDVTLGKVMDLIEGEAEHYRTANVQTSIRLDERSRRARKSILHGGRLLATYTMAQKEDLDYDADVSYRSVSPRATSYEQLDAALLARLKEIARSELDCQICYNLLLDPLTTTCGHTFCRNCVARVLDHSTLCPICRRALPMPPDFQRLPCNIRLSSIISSLCPDVLAARAEMALSEEGVMDESRNVPFFVCSLAFPTIATFLHIFEPRYRLMTRRVVEHGNRKFGMLMYNTSSGPQGDLGRTPFMQYGTLLHINTLQLLPDGRSLLETMGVSRFRVTSSSTVDGYAVGDVVPVVDISAAEEEALEAAEIRDSSEPTDLMSEIRCLKTRDLLAVCQEFTRRMRTASAPWMHDQVLCMYGSPPDDAALFPYWFASVLPIREEEKYKLLPTTSIRARLQITTMWVRRIEGQRW